MNSGGCILRARRLSDCGASAGSRSKSSLILCLDLSRKQELCSTCTHIFYSVLLPELLLIFERVAGVVLRVSFASKLVSDYDVFLRTFAAQT